MKALIVMAHPDDSFIFGHNIRQATPHIEWHDLCATYGHRTARGKEFLAACKVLKSRGIQLALDDDYQGTLTEDTALLVENIYQQLHNGYNYLVTHNPNGEYGHRHHRELHKHTMLAWSMLPVKERPSVLVPAFNYKVPDFTLYSETKAKSKCLQIYEREMYMIGNFDLIAESFVLHEKGERGPSLHVEVTRSLHHRKFKED